MLEGLWMGLSGILVDLIGQYASDKSLHFRLNPGSVRLPEGGGAGGGGDLQGPVSKSKNPRFESKKQSLHRLEEGHGQIESILSRLSPSYVSVSESTIPRWFMHQTQTHALILTLPVLRVNLR